MSHIEVIGIVGAALILVAFTMNQLKRWSTELLIYDIVNTVGSLLLVVYSVLLESVPFLILNTVWFVVSARDVVSAFRRK